MALSLRAKSIIVWFAMLLALALGLTLATTIALSLLKDRIVRDTIRLAEEQIGQLRDEVRDVILHSGAISPEDIRQLTAMRERFEIFLRDHDQIVSVVIIDENNNVIVRNVAGSGADVEVRRQRVEQPITAPIVIGERKIGDLQAMLSQSKTLRDIELQSRLITRLMSAFLVSMALILALLFALQWRLFRRHVDMVQRQDQIERMAYVGSLASGLAHEIRNPLNAMGLKLQVIEEDIADPRPESPARMKAVATTIRSQIEQLNATLSNFLTFALPGRRGATEFDLRALIREVRELLQPELDARGVEWIESAPAPVMLRGEPASFHEVIVNIVLNALYAMERVTGPRRLEVTLAAGERSARLEIADTGPGIPPADLKRVFEVFFTTREGGSGFGLAIARRIVEDHGGVLTASNRPAGGACFTIVVPLP